MKRAVIIGATSGIGREVAKQLLLQGWHLGIAGRRLPSLEALQSSAPDRVEVAALDVTQPDAAPKLSNLIRRVGGMDLFLLSSGIGYQNIGLNPDIELETTRTNVEGFTRMVDTAFNYFREHGGGQLAVISSVAGTKGLGVAPAYSATKRFQNTYIDALEQFGMHAKTEHLFYGHPPGLCVYRPAERRKTLSAIDATGKGSPADCTGIAPPETSGSDRLALCCHCLFLADDSALDMETAADTDRKDYVTRIYIPIE